MHCVVGHLKDGAKGCGGGGFAATAAETYQNSSYILSQSPGLPED